MCPGWGRRSDASSAAVPGSFPAVLRGQNIRYCFPCKATVSESDAILLALPRGNGLERNRPKQKATNRNRKGPRCSRFTHDGGTRQQAAAARSHFTRERSLVRNQPRPSHKVPAKTTVSRRARGSGLGPPEGRTPAFWDAPSGHVAAGHLRASRGGTRDDMAGSQPGLAVWLFKLALRLEHWPKPNGRRKRPRRGR